MSPWFCLSDVSSARKSWIMLSDRLGRRLVIEQGILARKWPVKRSFYRYGGREREVCRERDNRCREMYGLSNIENSLSMVRPLAINDSGSTGMGGNRKRSIEITRLASINQRLIEC